MTSNDVNWLLVYLLVPMVLVEGSGASVILCTLTLWHKTPRNRQACRCAVTIALAAAAAGAVPYMILGVRTGITDFSGSPHGRLASSLPIDISSANLT
jgi:hypothetical protein